MHVCIINFNLDGVTEEQYRALCDELAPAFAEVPGLASKTWLADPASGTYGGVYMWNDRESFEAFKASELAAGVMNHPAIANFSLRDFGVLEGPSAVTHGLVAAAA
jgi:hypothetical protein